MNKVIAEDDRIYLRRLQTTDDLSKYLTWINDPEMNRYLTKKRSQTLEDLRRYIDSHKNNYLCGIFSKSDDAHLGNVLASRIDYSNENCHIGIFVGKDSWGKGIGTLAVSLITDYMLYVKGLYKVTAGVARDNIGSCKLFEKVGYTLEFISKDEFKLEDMFIDHLYFTKYNKDKK